eukprot:m.31145 g.31145  ORF g.31145 m.31145 type:complete len:936 (-) comp9684_c0_seq6:1356-4163(-)
MPRKETWEDAVENVDKCIECLSTNETKLLRTTLKRICGMMIIEELKEENPSAFEAIQVSVSETIEAVPAWCTAKTPEARAEASKPLREGLETMKNDFDSLTSESGNYENMDTSFIPPNSDDDEEASDSESDTDDEQPQFTKEPARRKSIVQQLGSTTDLGPDMTGKIQCVLDNLEQLFNAASIGNVEEVDNQLFDVNKQLVVIEKFLGPVSQQSEEERRAVTAVRDSCISTQAIVRELASSNSSSTDQMMDAVVHLHVVIQEFFHVIQRMKYLSTVKGSPSIPFLSRLQKLLDDVATPIIQDEQVAFLECKQVILVAHDSITVSCQRLTACLLSHTPSNWKMVSACDQLVHAICAIVRVSDKLHKDQQSPSRRILYELGQIVVNSIGLLMELKADIEESRANFHAAINSLHVHIPALMIAGDELIEACKPLIDGAELKELSEEELDRDISDRVKLDVPEEEESVEEIEKKASQSDSRRIAMSIYLCTDKIKTKEDQILPIGRVLTFPKVSGGLTISNMKTVVASRYITPPPIAMTLLLAEGTFEESEKLATVAGENDRIQLFLYVKDDNFDLKREQRSLHAGEFPKPELTKRVSPREEDQNEECCAKGHASSSSLSVAARSSIVVDRSHWVKGGGVSFRKKKKLSPTKRTKEARCIQEGLLEKIGGTFQHWTTRWFVLLDDELLYFKQPTDTVPLALLKLNEFKLCHRISDSSSGDDDRHFLFQLVPQNPTARVYTFAAPSPSEQTKWIKRIDCSIPGRRCYCERVAMLQDIYKYFREKTALVKDDLFRANGNEQRIKMLAYAFGYNSKKLEFGDVTSPTDVVRLLKKLFETELVGPFVSCNAQILLQKSIEAVPASKQVSAVASLVNSQMNSAKDYKSLTQIIDFFEFILSHASDRPTMLKELCRSFGRPLFMFTTKGETILEIIIENRKEVLM